MAAYYRDGERHPLDASRSGIRFELHHLGVPTHKGVLRVSGGEVVVGSDATIRSADFRLDVVGEPLFGSDDHPAVVFTTSWSRPVGPGVVELEGILSMHGHDHLFMLRAGDGLWDDIWHRGTAHGILDRNTWVEKHGVADVIRGHDVHLVVNLLSGPRPQNGS